MLFVKSKTTRLSIDTASRISLLENLHEKGLVPLIHSSRLRGYELVLRGTDRLKERMKELEQAMARWADTQGESYVMGDVFCLEDCVAFLAFEDEEGQLAEVRAGIIYTAETTEALTKLHAFCWQLGDSLKTERSSSQNGAEGGTPDSAEWRLSEPRPPAKFARFVAKSVKAPLLEETTDEQRLALELMEDEDARRFLYDIRDAHADGRNVEYMAGGRSEATAKSLTNWLVGAGLIRLELLVRCRRRGRVLFRVPSADALALITASRAKCNECGAAIGDESITEDFIAPTELASMLLEDGWWLAHRLRPILSKLGIPEHQVAVAPASGDDETEMMVNVCGEPFLFVLKAGELTTADAQRVLRKRLETGISHLVVIATGKIQDEARALMLEHARRRASRGSDTEVILIQGVDAAAAELQSAFNRVSQTVIAKELQKLDAGLGLSIGYLIATAFRLKGEPGALVDMAESAAGMLIRELREI